MNKKKAMLFLSQLEKKGTIFGLQRIKRFLELLENPQNNFNSIHIAGSKGKGSTAAMIASILQKAGYKTGLYTSPHLLDIKERFAVNKKQISNKDFFARIESLQKTMLKQKIPLTHFEFLTALAFEYFSDKKIDFAVIETGMGGRLDATNVLLPRACAITNIEIEHEKFLGNSLEKIAAEKAGIIKQGVPILTAEKKAIVLSVFKRVCKKKNAKLIVVRKKFSSKLPLLGEFQKTNAALAVAIAAELNKQGFGISSTAIKNGLRFAKWPGRFEKIQKKPIVLLDCCHTENSATALSESFKRVFPKKKAILVVGVSDDKNIFGIARELSKITKIVFATEAKFRAMKAEKIAKEFEKHGVQVIVVRSVKSAMEKAIALAGKKEIVLVCGSCFVAGEAMQARKKSVVF